MPRPRPPHLHRETTRHGKTVWYVRVGHGPRIRLKAAFGAPGFDEEYQAALSGDRAPKAEKTRAGSLRWLWERYRETTAWTALSAATRRQRENIMRRVLKESGHKPFDKITETHVAAGRDRRSATPSQARHFLDAMRGLFAWAKGAGIARVDPVRPVDPPKRRKTSGFPAWVDADVEMYEVRWPAGTVQRVWLHVLLNTGLRRGDAVILGKQHFRGQRGMIRTEKTGTEVPLFMTPQLAATLAQGPTGDLAFICGEHGRPLTKESFGNAFSEACRDAGIKKSAHGVRKLAATRLAEAGATGHELEAVFGWTGGGMAALYTRAANRNRLAESAMDKLVGTSLEQAIPAPDEKVRERRRKA